MNEVLFAVDDFFVEYRRSLMYQGTKLFLRISQFTALEVQCKKVQDDAWKTLI
ncbi:hypothetical protein D3C74_36130 [compost metagenome]